MTATIWSKFFWADWQSDPALRACSLPARGLWMEMLCIAAGEGGYLARDGKPLPAQTLAAIVGQPAAAVEALIAELEENRVFSRDRRGRIYSRRMVRECKHIEASRKGGKKGGAVSRDSKKGIFAQSDHPLATPSAPISHKPESKSQAPESMSHPAAPAAPRAAPEASPVAPLIRAAEAMGTTLDALHRKPAWLVFGDTFATWLEEGCDAERDVWPTLARLALKRRKIPASPAYFTQAVREARDKRRESPGPASHTIGAPYLASTALVAPAFVTAEQWAERARVFHIHGLWSRRWGPKPGEPGCVALQESGISYQGSEIRNRNEHRPGLSPSDP